MRGGIRWKGARMRRHIRLVLAFAVMGGGSLVSTDHAVGLSSVIDPKSAVFAPAIATGADGRNVVSYTNGFGEVRVAHCSDLACTSARSKVLSRDGLLFDLTAVAIGGDGNPIVAFRDGSYERLVIAKCNNAACTGASQTTIQDASYPYVDDVRATAGGDGFLLVASVVGPTPSGPLLLVRHCQDLACRRSNTTEIDARPPGEPSTFAISTDANGLGVVAYVRGTLGWEELVLAHCVDQACTRVTKTLIDASAFVMRGVSVRTMADNRLLVVYNQGELLKSARCLPVGDNPCASWTTSVLEESVGFRVELALGDGNGLIGYRDEEIGYKWRIARCVNDACSEIQKGVAVNAAGSPDFALGSTAESPSLGLAVFSDSARRLATEHCADVACSAFSP